MFKPFSRAVSLTALSTRGAFKKLQNEVNLRDSGIWSLYGVRAYYLDVTLWFRLSSSSFSTVYHDNAEVGSLLANLMWPSLHIQFTKQILGLTPLIGSLYKLIVPNSIQAPAFSIAFAYRMSCLTWGSGRHFRLAIPRVELGIKSPAELCNHYLRIPGHQVLIRNSSRNPRFFSGGPTASDR